MCAIPTEWVTKGLGLCTIAKSLEPVIDAFHQVHEKLYTYSERDNLCELISIGCSVFASQPAALMWEASANVADATAAREGSRPVYFPESGEWVDTPVFVAPRRNSSVGNEFGLDKDLCPKVSRT